MKSHFVKRTYEEDYTISYIENFSTTQTTYHIFNTRVKLLSEEILFTKDLDCMPQEIIYHNGIPIKILYTELSTDNCVKCIVGESIVPTQSSIVRKAELEKSVLDCNEANKRVVELEEEIEMLKSKSLWQRLWGI